MYICPVDSHGESEDGTGVEVRQSTRSLTLCSPRHKVPNTPFAPLLRRRRSGLPLSGSPYTRFCKTCVAFARGVPKTPSTGKRARSLPCTYGDRVARQSAALIATMPDGVTHSALLVAMSFPFRADNFISSVHTRSSSLRRLWQPHPSANLRIANENRKFRGQAPTGGWDGTKPKSSRRVILRRFQLPSFSLAPRLLTLTRCSCFYLWDLATGTKYRSAPQVARNPCFATHLVLPTGHDVKGQCPDDLSVVDMEEVRVEPGPHLLFCQ